MAGERDPAMGMGGVTAGINGRQIPFFLLIAPKGQAKVWPFRFWRRYRLEIIKTCRTGGLQSDSGALTSSSTIFYKHFFAFQDQGFLPN
jgi:hypothetical protein